MAACDDGTAHCNISIRSISRSQLKPLVVGQLINQAFIFLRVPRDAYRFPQAAMPVPEDLFCWPVHQCFRGIARPFRQMEASTTEQL
ncbi:hypothetical protein T12_3522 [Trichinella patagoniensis]|uniref:Uncharacterized protein n=1 Tax=Trichinella patagoniensis TaxID=990121 RepID=A0A0V0ZGM0_9BILA|nr:hypothetical protein T12_3522 [Trichinella patagoniensis]